MNFEWDPKKAKKNLIKHKISFEEASSVFYDPLAVSGSDPDHSIGEERMVTFGISSSGRLVVVAHVDRGNNIRIISARIAAKNERKIYEDE